MTLRPRVLIADSSPLFRLGVRNLLESRDSSLRICEADRLKGRSAYLQGAGSTPELALETFDLLILDRNLPGLRAFRQLKCERSHWPPVLLMAEVAELDFLQRASQHRVPGVINKGAPPALFWEAASTLRSGATWYAKPCGAEAQPTCLEALSEKQQRVLSLVREGKTNKQIAKRLCLAESTVKHHISQIYRQMNFTSPNRTLLAVSAPHTVPYMKAD